MTEEMPKNYRFLKFIVIFMGILILLGLSIMVWKVIDLAQKKAEPEGGTSRKILLKPFGGKLVLRPGEKILEISAAAEGLWIRIGRDGASRRLILTDFTGKIIGKIRIKRDEDPVAAR